MSTNVSKCIDCGGNPRLYGSDKDRDWFSICECGRSPLGYFDTEQDALDAWENVNKSDRIRKLEEELYRLKRIIKNAFESGMVDGYNLDQDERYCPACGNDLMQVVHEQDCPVLYFQILALDKEE